MPHMIRHVSTKVSNGTVSWEVCMEKEEADLSPNPPLLHSACDTQLGCGQFTAIPC